VLRQTDRPIDAALDWIDRGLEAGIAGTTRIEDVLLDWSLKSREGSVATGDILCSTKISVVSRNLRVKELAKGKWSLWGKTPFWSTSPGETSVGI
jgi:hypothetical protein